MSREPHKFDSRLPSFGCVACNAEGTSVNHAEGLMSNPVEALIVKWRLFASDLRDTTGYNKNYLCQRQVACLHQCADELASTLASLRPSPEVELQTLRDTVRRLNRRCQLAEAAANLKVEEWDKRSKGAGRAYVFQLGKDEGREEALASLRGAAETLEIVCLCGDIFSSHQAMWDHLSMVHDCEAGRGAAEKPHAITRLKRDTWFDLNAPTDRTWPQGTRELCERAYQDGLAGRGAAEPEQPHPHVCHDRNPPFPGPCPACESERGEAAPVPAPPEKAENQTPADRASERNLA